MIKLKIFMVRSQLYTPSCADMVAVVRTWCSDWLMFWRQLMLNEVFVHHLRCRRRQEGIISKLTTPHTSVSTWLVTGSCSWDRLIGDCS